MVDTKVIKSELVKKGLNYASLSKVLNISISTLGNKMNYRTSFTADELIQIAAFFNKEVTFFLKDNCH